VVCEKHGFISGAVLVGSTPDGPTRKKGEGTPGDRERDGLDRRGGGASPRASEARDGQKGRRH